MFSRSREFGENHERSRIVSTFEALAIIFFDWLLSDGQSTIFCVTPSKMRDVTKQQIQMRAFTSMYSHGISYAHRSLRDTSDEPVFC
jgi:hypothetical protein